MSNRLIANSTSLTRILYRGYSPTVQIVGHLPGARGIPFAMKQRHREARRVALIPHHRQPHIARAAHRARRGLGALIPTIAHVKAQRAVRLTHKGDLEDVGRLRIVRVALVCRVAKHLPRCAIPDVAGAALCLQMSVFLLLVRKFTVLLVLLFFIG